MTQDTEQMPGRIWATPDMSGVAAEWKCGWFNGRPTERSTLPYVRGDIYDAQAAQIAALEERLRKADEAISALGRCVAEDCAARAALEGD